MSIEIYLVLQTIFTLVFAVVQSFFAYRAWKNAQKKLADHIGSIQTLVSDLMQGVLKSNSEFKKGTLEALSAFESVLQEQAKQTTKHMKEVVKAAKDDFENETKSSIVSITEKAVESLRAVQDDVDEHFKLQAERMEQKEVEHANSMDTHSIKMAGQLAIVLETRAVTEMQLEKAQRKVDEARDVLIAAQKEAEELVERSRFAAEQARQACLAAEEHAKKVRSLPKGFGPSSSERHEGFASKTGNPFDPVA